MIAAAITLVAPGCSTPRLYYETTVFQHAPLKATKGQRAGLIKAVREALADRPLHVAAGGAWRKVHPGKALERTEPALLYAVMAVADEDFLGAEADILIRGPGKRRMPVTVQVALDGQVYVSPGAGPPKTWAWKKVGGTKSAMYGLLRIDEQAVLEGIRWKRSGRGPGLKGAQYAQKGCTAEIRVFDTAYAGDGFQFVGDPKKPKQAALRALLHEVGHALHNKPAREAWCSYEYERKRGDSSRAASWGARAQALDETGGPVLSAYRKVLGDGEAPTVYGEESIEESFAESFSIWKSDPAALERALPSVHRWFSELGHIKALR